MRKNNLQLKSILSIIIVIILLIIGIFYYINDIRNSLWKQVVSEILEVTSQGSHAFELYIENDMQLLTRIEKHLSLDSSKNETSIIDTIEDFKDLDVDFTVIDSDNGIMYSKNTYNARKMSADELKTYEGFSAKGVREPYIDEYTGEKVIGCYQRFTFSDGTHGIVQVKRPVSTVADEFMLSFYDNAGFSYIANARGDILVRSSHKNSKDDFSNILDVIELSGNNKKDIHSFNKSISMKKEGAIRLIFNGEENLFAFTPVKSTDEWYLIAIVPDSIIMKHANDVLKSSHSFVFLFGGIFIIIGLFVYMEILSRKKLMEKEGDVQYREQLFNILANNTNDVFLMFSTNDHTVEYISPNVERVLGISTEEIKNDIKVLEKYSSDKNNDNEFINKDVIDNLEIGDSIIYEKERIHKNNKERRWFMETIYKTSINDSERFVAVLSDRTHEEQRKQVLKEALEIAKTANESKSVFLSNMSHDIRTPMNAIVGLSTLLQRDAHDPEKVREYTRKITASSQHLLGLINDILDMSKIESGKATLNISEISLAEIIEELGIMIQPQAKAKNQKFKIDVYDVCNEEVLGDQLRINQILINILSNAVKYTPIGGSIEMTVRQLPQYSKNYARFHFIVKDNGIGMSKEYLETIFQPFTREDTKKTLNIQGTGLGMAITKNLVDLMGGTIEVTSEINKGTTFIVDLELRIKEQDIDPDFWKKHNVTNLLVVDDDEEICLGIKNIMADTGVNMQYALGGQVAVQMTEKAEAEGNGFDLVLIDWQMPDISGIETARRIRKIIPSNVPIMILTAYDINKIEQEGIEAGIDGFLQKPFFLSNFKLTMDNLKAENSKDNNKDEIEKNSKILTGKNILAAEDIELNMEILQELLKTAGATCDWANNGKEALEKFEQSPPGFYDVILMDVQMPVMNGYEATKAIRNCYHPQAKTIPIIAMTANAFSEDVKDALSSGMNKHVAKPIDIEHLKTVIKEVLS